MGQGNTIRIVLSILLFFIGTCAETAVKAQTSFQQDATGLVSIEAEHFHAQLPQGGRSWDPAPTPASGFSGDGTLQALPDSGITRTTGYELSSPQLDYQIEFNRTGTHYVWVRALGINHSGNSLHIGLNGQGVTGSSGVSIAVNGNYGWRRRAITIPSVGVHTLNIWMREDGTVVDKLVVTSNQSFTPTGLGPPESGGDNTFMISDDFNDGNAQGWTVVNDSGTPSNWIAMNGQYHQRNSMGSFGSALQGNYHVGTYTYLSSGTGLTDYQLSVKVIPLATSGQDVGIMVRRRDNNNYYRLSLNSSDGFTRFEKKVNGQFATLAKNARGYEQGAILNLFIEVKGPVLVISVNGEKLFGIHDTSLSSGTVALYCRDACAYDDVRIQSVTSAPTVAMMNPMDFSVLPTVGFEVSAVAINIPTNATVTFELDNSDTLCNGTTEPNTGLFRSQCTALSQSTPHEIAAILRDQNGTVVDTDTHTSIGADGNIYVSVGDSISNGVGDNFATDGVAEDGWMISFQGYQPNLINLLNSTQPSLNLVLDDAVPGDKSSHALNDRIASTIERHDEATHVLMALGTNDASGTTPVAHGLGCSGASCQGTFKGNMQAVLDIIDAAGKTTIVALVPPRFGDNAGSAPYTNPLTHPKNILNQQYNQVILNELSKRQTGPDLFEFSLVSANRFSLFADNLHPNALGNMMLAYLWHNAIVGGSTLPFILENICVRTIQAGACEEPLRYKQNLLEIGDHYYVDRSFTLQNSIPDTLRTGRWVMTADDDKDLNNSDYLSFNITQSSTLYIAYDSAAATLPTWMTGFVDTGLQIQTSDGASPLLSLYKFDNAAGDIVLGGADAVSTGASANYLVIVVPN